MRPTITLIILMAASAVVVAGCPKQQTIVRDGDTFTIETLASLARQEEAAAALRFAATEAATNGDMMACTLYAEPALLIEAAARPQAYRALWLAGLPYPGGPEDGSAQPDPGPAPETENTTTICH